MNGENRKITLSVITPMYNESAVIVDNIRKIRNVLEVIDIAWEYILVNDGSNDNSAELARREFADDPRCTLVSYEGNRGRGYALARGIDKAGGEYVITTESDLSWGEDIIPRIYNALQDTGADMVIASVHRSGGSLQNVPLRRRLLTKVGNLLLSSAFGGRITMLSGMTRGYRWEAIKSLLLEEPSKEIHLEIVTKAIFLDWRIHEIPATISWQPCSRRSGSLRKMMVFILPHLLLLFQQAATKIMLWLMLLLMGAGGLLICLSALNKFWQIFPWQMPFLLSYGLVLTVLSMLLGCLSLLSIQIQALHRRIIKQQADQRIQQHYKK